MLDVAIDNQFDFQSDEYADLFRRAVATAFQHPDWLSAIYRRLVPQLNVEPLIVTVRAAPNRRLLMVLPLIRRRYGALRVRQLMSAMPSGFAGNFLSRYFSIFC